MTAITIAAIVSLVVVTLCLALVVCALSLIGKTAPEDKDPDAASVIWRRTNGERRRAP